MFTLLPTARLHLPTARHGAALRAAQQDETEAELGMSELGMSEMGMSEMGMLELGMSELGMLELGPSVLELRCVLGSVHHTAPFRLQKDRFCCSSSTHGIP